MDKKNVVIVGGGTAGWLTASILLSDKNKTVNVTIIEDEYLSPIGVGEGTTVDFYRLMESLKIEHDSIGATKKYGIHYLDWYSNNLSKYNSWFHPFYKSSYDTYNKLVTNYDYDKIMNPAELYHNNDRLVGLHFNAGDLISVLKEKCLKMENPITSPCNYIKSTVVDCELDEKGNINSVILKGDKKIKGDFFVDCTGFKRVLISKMKPKFIDYSNELICDRALVTQLNNTNEYGHYWTRATALSSGWSWNIPTQNKTGTGYVYSSQFISDDDAKKEFNKHLATDEDFRVIKWKTEVIDIPFIKNCITIGLSSGFFEPMEATNIQLIQGHGIMFRRFLRNNCSNDMKESLNNMHKWFVNHIWSYLFFHYYLSKRDDSKFWNYISKEVSIPDSMKENLNKTWPDFINFSKDEFRINNLSNKINNKNSEIPLQLISWLYLFSGYNIELES